MPEHSQQALEAEIQALRDENRSLRAAHQAAGSPAATAAAGHYQAQERFRTAFEHSPLGHKIVGPDLAIRQANAAMAALLGLASPLELLGHCLLDYVHPDHHAEWVSSQATLWSHHTPSFALETRLLQPNGAYRWCRVTSILFPDAGGQLGFSTIEDISSRKQLEADLQYYAQQQATAHEELNTLNEELAATNEELHATNVELSHVNTELDTFVYAASHDLRTPVANLEGLLQLLTKNLPAEIRSQKLTGPTLTMMKTSLARFRASLDRLADFGTARQSTAATLEKVVLAEVLEDVRGEIAPLLTATNGQLHVELAGNLHLWFSRKHLHSVLLNLVSNALKYRHPHRAPLVHVYAYWDARQLVLQVKDNGRGLTEAQQEQLFRMFRRFHPDVEGTGMGLYLVKRILAHTGGSIQVQSQLDYGTTFSLVFPA